MASARQSLSPVLLLLALAAAGLGLWLLLDNEDEAFDPEADDAGEIGFERDDSTSLDERSRPDARTRAAAVERTRGLPRVLPPDAAVEDVRDALALAEAERAPSLAKARDSISRLALQGARVLSGLRNYAEKVEDPVVRGVVTSALGSNREARHVRWLCAQLEEGETDAERIGGLIALAHPLRAGKSDVTRAPHHATSTTLGGLPYSFAPLPDSMNALKSGSRFLDSASGASVEDALPVLVRSVEASPEWTTLLVVDGKRMCSWYTALSEESRELVRAAALGHAELPRDVRKTIEASK